MELFTVKDFIVYNNPCFSCGENIIFTFGGAINPVINGNWCAVKLVTTYSSSLTLRVELSSNKFEINGDIYQFKKYLFSNFPMRLMSRCSKCKTEIRSEAVEFDFNKRIIKPFKISDEKLIVREPDMMYHILSVGSHSRIEITDIKKGISVLSIDVNCPLNLARIKTRENLIKKLKTYVIFS